MFCPKCGNDLKENYKICPICGYNLDYNNVIKSDDKVHCPRCNSSDVIVSKKGYNTNAIGCTFVLIILGFLTFGVAWIVLIISLLTGFIGSDKLQWICKRCGNKWVQKF